MKTARILFVCLIFSVLYFLFVADPALAQAPNPYTAPNTNPDVPNNLHNYTQNVMIEVMSALSCQLTGIDPTNPKQECLGVDQKTGKIGFVQSGGGAVGVMGNLIAMTFTPPINTADYFNNLAQNFGIAKPAFAFIPEYPPNYGHVPPPPPSTGIGLTGITPLLDIWSAFRNIVYLLFVLVFVIVGVAIMLRVRIDPRTVMTIQNQIPKIIVGILLVTFSFAIAGFLIDLMYVFIYLIFGIISGIPHVDVSQLSPSNLQGGNPFNAAGGLGGIGSIAHHASGGVGNIIASVFDGKAGMVIAGIIGTIIGAGAGSVIPFIGTIVGAIIGGIAGAAGGSAALGLLGSLIAFIIIAVALLWALFRLWFTLLSAYVFILLDIVLAPFWIVAGLFPGSSINFSVWIRDIVANLAAFPATIALFLLAKVFMDTLVPAQNQFVPPLIGNPGDLKSFTALIDLGMILMTPNIVTMLRKALKTPQVDLSAAGAAIGVGVGTPSRLIGGGINTAVSPHYGVPPGAPPGTPPQLLYPQSSLGRFLRGFGIAK